jgi:hypothetical protein
MNIREYGKLCNKTLILRINPVPKACLILEVSSDMMTALQKMADYINGMHRLNDPVIP